MSGPAPRPPPRGKIGQCYIRGLAQPGRPGSSGLTRRQILRAKQREAEAEIAARVDDWFESIRGGAPGGPGQRQRQQAMPSAYECAEEFHMDVPQHSKHPSAAKYDYAKHAEGGGSDTQLFGQTVPRGGVVERMLRDTVGDLKLRYDGPPTPPRSAPQTARQSLKHDIESVRPRKSGPSQASVDFALPSSRGTGTARSVPAWDPADADTDASVYDSESYRPKPSFKVPFTKGRSFGWEKRDPNEAAKNAQLRQEEREYFKDERDKEWMDRHVTHLALRENQLAKLREKTRTNFEKALLRAEPHALKKLDAYLLNQWGLEASRTEGRRCHPSQNTPEFGFTLTSDEESAGMFLHWLRASARRAITEDERPPAVRDADGKRKGRMRSKRISQAHVVHPVMPRTADANRRDATGQLLHADKLKPPRPTMLMSDVSRRITEGIKRELPVRVKLTPEWDLTPAEVHNELADFEQRVM
eukprot:TRINITY_DN8247_c0_g2_i1.p1 TRINITY_DN8247_c0_g2~~TRINITY_DN8247_c0_g2_i1.p1  ORF type:complete len:486 (+),score=174.40 TRINITY_DN8247_c0_g2_i1:44-1459(+)